MSWLKNKINIKYALLSGGLKFGLSLHLCAYFGSVGSEGSGQTVHLSNCAGLSEP